ncbi:MAG: hypothetical protein B6229_10460 [Spirochaetaceae bacterium 4572_7]|nr:MAG: hypothetical protein B6229_10460 [Spirochaetaceae bacterium 4572_7]
MLDSGKNVYPEELEAFYSDSKLISDIAVFGIMVNGSETVFAVIVPIKANITYKELKLEITRLGRGLPTYKTVKDFAISVDPLPKTTKRTNINSKIIDNLEQGLYNRGEGEAGIEKELTANDPKKIAIINILKDELKSKKLYCSQNLRDFNIDSLGSMNLIVQLEVKLSIKIEEKIFSAAENLENLTNYLSICKRGEGRTTFDELINGKIETKSVAFFNPIFELLLVIFRFLSKIKYERIFLSLGKKS